MCSQQHNKPHLANVRQRTLLLLSRADSAQTISDKLSQYAWQCLLASTSQQAIVLLNSHQVRIALAQIDSHSHSLATDIRHIQHHFPHLLWQALTEHTLEHPCHWLFAAHFIDYHHLPLDWDNVNRSLGHAEGMAKLLAEGAASTERHEIDVLHEIQGSHPCIAQLKQDIHKLAHTDETILLSGETGTGKSLCARWLHTLSRRAEGPFVSVNCGALPASLIQSTLFGHEKGAFTGADKRYIGHIEQAEGGTLFLDEIADLPLELQVNLLHFLDNQHILRIGSSQPIKVDCQLIFATHIDLENAVEEGKFREDLYHRINVLRLHIPSLRDYKSDIMMLAEQFLHNTAAGQKRQFADDAVESICNYSWPGNVRELQNRVRRAMIMSDGPIIHADALGIPSHLGKLARTALPLNAAQLDANVLFKAVADNHNNISAAAKQLKISRSTFYRLIKKCNIQR